MKSFLDIMDEASEKYSWFKEVWDEILAEPGEKGDRAREIVAKATAEEVLESLSRWGSEPIAAIPSVEVTTWI